MRDQKSERKLHEEAPPAGPDQWDSDLDDILNNMSPAEVRELSATPPRAPRQPRPPVTPAASKAQEELDRAVDQSVRNLSELAAEGRLEPVYGRDLEMRAIMSALRRKRRSNVLLHGAPGVGKTAMAEALAVLLVSGDVEPKLAMRPVWDVSLGGLVAGTKYRGDFEARIDCLVARAIAAHAILFIDEAHMLAGSGSTSGRAMDGANILKPALARGDFSLIGATTTSEMAMLTADRALMRRFEIMELSEPDAAATTHILQQAGQSLLEYHGIAAEDKIFARITAVCDARMPDRHFPDKAFDLLDQACVRCRETGATVLQDAHVVAAARRMGARLPRLPDVGTRGAFAALNADLAATFPALGNRDALMATVSCAWSALSDRAGCAGAWHVTDATREDATHFADLLGHHLGLPVSHIEVGVIQSRVELGRLVGQAIRMDPLEPRGELIEAVSRGAEQIIHVTGLERCDPAVGELLCDMVRHGVVKAADGRVHRAAGVWLVMSEPDGDIKGSVGFGRSHEGPSRSRALGDPGWSRLLSARVALGVRSPATSTKGNPMMDILRDMAGVTVAVSDNLAEDLSWKSACDTPEEMAHDLCMIISRASAGLPPAKGSAYSVTFASDGCVIIDRVTT